MHKLCMHAGLEHGTVFLGKIPFMYSKDKDKHLFKEKFHPKTLFLCTGEERNRGHYVGAFVG